jgi:DNA transformation protein and related proteins
MSVSADFLTYVLDQLKPFGRVVTRRMFGGVGLYSDELFFGLLDDDTIYLKVDDTNRGDYVARGCKPFRPLTDDPDAYSMSYFEVPADVLEDPDDLKIWARKSLSVAAAAAAVKAKRKKKSPQSTRSPRRS